MPPRSTEPSKPLRADRVVDGLFWGEAYLVIGKPSETSLDNEISGPPWAGQGGLFVVDKGGKNVTLFAPYQMEAFSISRHCFEYRGIKPARDPFDRDRAVASINRGWDEASKYGFQRDFDTAAMVLQMLGAPVPIRVTVEGAEPDKPRGGKEADVLGLLKPVKRTGRRGEVLRFFLAGPRSIREAMAEFGVTRSNLLSQLYLLQKDHGIGYSLVGDAATVTLPAGCTDPFEPEAGQ